MLDTISIKEIESDHIFLPSEKLKQKITTKNIPPSKKNPNDKGRKRKEERNYSNIKY